MKYLIAGLGNIGSEYTHTRHNIGFMVLDRLVEQAGASFNSGRYAFYAKFKYKSRVLCCVKPTTYMNLSGKAVSHWLRTEKIPQENLLVVVDDLALPLGSLRLREKGGTAGHNGLKDIELRLGHSRYPRLRCGIDNNFAPGRQADYVLSDFAPDEAEQLPALIEKAGDMVLSFATIGIARTMTNFND